MQHFTMFVTFFILVNKLQSIVLPGTSQIVSVGVLQNTQIRDGTIEGLHKHKLSWPTNMDSSASKYI